MVDFLEAMRTAALAKGMMQIHDSLGGGVSAQDLARIASELDRFKGSGQLVAVARRDLYTTSPLDVRIMVVTSRRK